MKTQNHFFGECRKDFSIEKVRKAQDKKEQQKTSIKFIKTTTKNWAENSRST